MPLSNPFRRQSDRPSLKERAADLKASLSAAIRKTAAAPATEPDPAPASSLEDFAEIEFSAYTFDDPVKTPAAWAARFAEHAMAMHIADRTVRMTKPEMISFIREAGEEDAGTPAAMFNALDCGHGSLGGWANLLGLARARYIVAASAACAGPAAQDQDGEPAADEAEAQPETVPPPPASYADQVAQAGIAGDVLAASGIDHRDGTVSYADATGKVVRRPMAHWIAFNSQQMHLRVQQEIGRRRNIEATHLDAEAHAAWEAGIRLELRSDAVHSLAFRRVRAFEAEEAFRSGAEPASHKLRKESDAELMALVPLWEAAMDLYQQRIDEQGAVEATASGKGWPGPAPDGSGPEWKAWFQQKEEWRERTGVAAAEEAASEAGTALYEIEGRIAGLSAASIAGIKFKARVAQYNDDIGVSWPNGLGAGLARDILAISEAKVTRPEPSYSYLVDQIDFASVPMAELLTIRDIAETIGNVAYAHSWGARCRKGTSPWGGAEHNSAGDLMQSLGDALTAVESAAEAEAKRRTPSGEGERETRLYMLATATIDNGDPDEIEAFARELLAHAEAEREGR